MSTLALTALAETSFTAMGTDVRILVPEHTPAGAVDGARSLFMRHDAVLSRFRASSELTALNGSAGAAFTASPLLFASVRAALAAARATEGAYDPGMGAQIAALGYDRSFAEIGRTVPACDATMPGGDWRRVVVDQDARTITLPVGMRIDLGGIAKGRAVDAAFALLRDAGVTTMMVSAGGDLRVAGRPPVGPHWGITVPEAGDRVIALQRGALATSSTSGRRWRAGDTEHHHLIDPATGLPAARGVRAVTVAARSCAQAEVAAKAALVLGPIAGADLLTRLGVAALIVPDHGAPIGIGDWPAEDAPWT